MDHERDEANVMGQVAGIIAVMSAVVLALPPSTRKRLPQQIRAQFDSLIAAMRTTGTVEAEAGREGAEWVRDLFLRQLEQAATKKPKGSEVKPPASDTLDVEL